MYRQIYSLLVEKERHINPEVDPLSNADYCNIS